MTSDTVGGALTKAIASIAAEAISAALFWFPVRQ